MSDDVGLKQRRGSPQRGRPSPGTAGGRVTQGTSWVPVALALTAFAGVTAVGVLRGRPPDRRRPERAGRDGALAGEPEVERSITIGRAASELGQRWRDPGTLTKVMAGFAAVRAMGDGRMHWTAEGPLGAVTEWDSEMLADQPGEGAGWRSLPGAPIPNEGSIRFRPAPADRGTVATLRVRFDPPGGMLGDAAVALLGTAPLDLVADGVLRRFKSLVETGEIPTTERQPAARADTR
ncbi:MAG: SRPBCC family protein [Methylobacteriaceae bacterium]|nr:SRPBCC family protein [Methylobacteriaceae bacterium]